MREGSVIRRVADLLLEETRRLGRGVTAREIADTLTERYGATETRVIYNALAKLARRGVARKIGGRIKRTQYAHVDFPVAYSGSDDQYSVVLAVTQTEAHRLKRAVLTSEIMAALRERDAERMTTDQLLTRLNTLARSTPMLRHRAHPDWNEAKLQRIEEVTQGGRKRAFWAPAEGEWSLPRVTDGCDACRSAVYAAVAEVGRPVSKRELRFWAYAIQAKHAADPEAHSEFAESVTTRGFWSRLNGAASRDAQRSTGPRRIRSVRTPWTARGPYPRRFSVPPVSDEQEGACLLDDLIVLLRPTDEVEGLQDLRAMAETYGSAVLADVIETRERLLRRQVEQNVPASSHLLPWLSAAVGVSVQARAVLRDWVAVSPWSKARRDQEMEKLGDADRHMEVLLALFRDGEKADHAEIGAAASIADSEGSPLEAFSDLLEEMVELNGLRITHKANVLAEARRLKGSTTGGLDPKASGGMYVLIDRPDAIRILVFAVHLPRLGAIIETAESILGHILRDPSLLLKWLRDTPRHDTLVRTGLVAALGLLGTVPPLELACPDPTEPDDMEAYLATVALGEDDEDERIRLAEVADLRARGAACGVTTTALGKLRCGERLSVLD